MSPASHLAALEPEPVRHRLRRTDRERQLLIVAEAVFAEQGYRGSSMEEIARRAGVTKPVLYDHFGSKDGLLSACIGKGRLELYEATLQATGGVNDPAEALRCGIRVFFEFVAARGQTWSMLMRTAAASDVASSGVEQGRRQQHELTAALLSRIAPDSSPQAREVQAHIINGACERVATWWGAHPEVSIDAVTDAVVAFLVPGLVRGWNPAGPNRPVSGTLPSP